VEFWRGWPYPAAVAMLFVVAMLRAGATYALGRAAQTGARRTRIAKLMARPGFGRVQDMVARWGAPVVTLSFLTVGIQTLVNLVAGMTQMPLRRYVPALAAGSLLWGLLYATVGFAGVTAWWQLYLRSPLAAGVLLVVVVLGVTAYVVLQVRRHRSAQVESSAH
jgi:membrane protein DedA with SNARE-associated domain